MLSKKWLLLGVFCTEIYAANEAPLVLPELGKSCPQYVKEVGKVPTPTNV